MMEPQGRREIAMKSKRPFRVKLYTRAVVAIMLITTWCLAALTGFLLWLAPTGPRSGQMPLLFEMTKSEWGDIHFWISVAAIVVTLLHMVVDWRALRGVIRYMISVHRSPDILK